MNIANDRGSVARIHGAVAVTAMVRAVRNVRITLSPPRTMPMAFVAADHPQQPSKDDLVTRLMLELAGTEAIRLFRGTEPGVPSGALTVIDQLRTECGEERDTPVIVEECRAEIARILNANRGLVDLLGEVLLREGSLDSATIQQLGGESLIL